MTFEVGQKVVYPNHGVSVVEEISSAKFDDIDQTLFHLRLLSNNSKVMVPKDNLDLVGLRPLGDKALIQELFETSKTATSTPTRTGKAATSRTSTR